MPKMCCDKSTTKEQGFDVQSSYTIDGHRTEIVFQRFVNRWFLLITQYNKLPNIFTVEFDLRREQASRIAVDDPIYHQSIPVAINCNFGEDKVEMRSAIQFLVNKTKLSRCPTEFVVSLGLKEINPNVLRALAKVIDEHIL